MDRVGKERSGGNQREAVGNKDAGVQSGVSQSWRAKQDEEEADKQQISRQGARGFFYSAGLEKVCEAL